MAPSHHPTQGCYDLNQMIKITDFNHDLNQLKKS
jgi:hypothetical protein